jgi:hypothetical protein
MAGGSRPYDHSVISAIVSSFISRCAASHSAPSSADILLGAVASKLDFPGLA